MPSFSAVLVTGGKSTRMGKDKALLSLQGSHLMLWQRQLRTLEDLQPEEIFWSGPAREGLPAHVRVVVDTVPDAGPLAGISACLELLQSELLIVLAIDLPFLSATYLQRMLDRCAKARGIVPRHKDYYEPLAAIYPKTLAVTAAAQLSTGRYALQEFVRTGVEQGALRAFAIEEKDIPLFKNLNLPADLS